MFAYCENNPINRIDQSGQFWDAIVGFFEDVVDTVCDVAQTAIDIIGIATSNLTIDAGICIGVGGEFDVGTVEIEAIARMDIVGIQIADNDVKVGHFGRTAFQGSVLDLSAGFQSETYETFDGEREVYPDEYFGYGDWSTGKSAAFGFGYHVGIEYSFDGLINDLRKYFWG